MKKALVVRSYIVKAQWNLWRYRNKWSPRGVSGISVVLLKILTMLGDGLLNCKFPSIYFFSAATTGVGLIAFMTPSPTLEPRYSS